MATTQYNEEELRDSLKRCSEQTIEAAIAYRQDGDPLHISTIVLGIIERFVEPEVRSVIRENADQARLLEDLGIDSLLMVEIIMLVEETLDIQIENEELRHLRTIGDIKDYLSAKTQGLPLPTTKLTFSLEQVAAAMPHQAPFLFLNEARLNSRSAEGAYCISGDESFLHGHFPENPVFPASLMLEALGQLAVLFMIKGETNAFGGSVNPKKIFFVSCDGVRCHKMCRPGDTLQLMVSLKKVHAPLAQFEGTILCNGVKVAKAEEISLTFDLIGDTTEVANA
jgi:3-hydroxyacyl-[acyl-carrier-protein] dehydratase